MTRLTNAIRLAIMTAAISTAPMFAQYTRAQVGGQPALAIAVSADGAGGQGTKDTLLAGTEKFGQGATKVTEINLDPNTMGMMGHNGREADLAHKMTLMTVHTYSYDKPGMYRKEDVEAFRKKLEDGSWNCYVHTRSESGTSDICARAGADHETNEMVIVTTRETKLTFIHMSGKLSLNELSEMSGSTAGISAHEFTQMPMPPMPPLHAMPVAPKAPTASPAPPQ